MRRFVVIAGMGRSGSNRLLDVFDRSSETVCRNEVNSISGSQFHGLGGHLFPEDLTDDIRTDLMAAVGGSLERRSCRDRFDMTRKDFFVSGVSPALWIMSKTKARRAMAKAGLISHENEWRVPRALLRPSTMKAATSVLKLGACPAWTIALHEMSPDCLIVLNIRSPRDYLNSWYNRLFLKRDRDHFRENFPSARRILDHFGADRAERLSRLTDEDIVEIEVWRWRYTNELIYRALNGSDRFTIVTYDEVETDSVATADRLFRFAGLRDDPVAKERVAGMRNTLFTKPASEKLDPDLCTRLLRDVLHDSPLKEIPNLRI